eukprot:TRINITY_DN3210_c0_g1_i1.p1 TRINITY_DN3210_c0_g1~~TRINITY_DN3210_c0_g1_i1.p1  ORF type:complete len:306 (-),score=63.15 TRINITY_DN3210_c0_g1_i1:776-1693(-)
MNDLLSHSMRAVDGGRDFHVVDLGNGTELANLDSGGYMKAVYDEVDIIRKEMAQVKELLVKLQSANEESKTILKATGMKALRERMDKDIEAVSKTARSIKQRLENLEKKNLANRKNPGYEEGTGNDRLCTSIINAERKKLKDLLEGFQVLREKIMTDYKETVERRYFTITGERADDATIEHIIDTGESETFLQRAIQEQGRGHILETIKEIQERHDAVKDIEKSLLELHEIFLDMSVLVDAQGAILNNIEQNVIKTRDHVDSGTRQLAKAKKHQRSSRKCMCIGIILLLIIIAIIVIPLVTTLKR